MSDHTNLVGRGGSSVPVKTGITASTTSTQAAATQLIEGFNNVTVSAGDTNAVKLPAAKPGAIVHIKNTDAAQDIVIFPSTGDTINGGSVNAVDGTALGEGASRTYIAESATNWVTFAP